MMLYLILECCERASEKNTALQTYRILNKEKWRRRKWIKTEA
jgi:hypothetical protein